MSTEQKHTPIPYRHVTAGENHWIKAGDRVIAFIGGNDGVFTTTPGTRHADNAVFIVRACNSYDDMLEVLKAVLKAHPLHYGMTEHKGLMAQVEAAIAKANA